LNLSPGGIGIASNFEEEIEIRKSIQSYVEILPLRKITEYLDQFLEIVGKIGFSDVFIFLDEADHLEHTDQFIRLLTRSREVLFTRGFNFFIAGSIELAKYLESMGTIFDKVILVRPADWLSFQETLEQRIKLQNPKLSLTDIFEEQAIQAIFDCSQGIRKTFLRLAQNTLDIAIMQGDTKVGKQHCEWVSSSAKDEVIKMLNEKEIAILQHLARHTACSPSQGEFQNAIQLKRVQLRKNLEILCQKGYVHKEKKGKGNYYSIAVQYRPYFKN
jgi:hypothetical protein